MKPAHIAQSRFDSLHPRGGDKAALQSASDGNIIFDTLTAMHRLRDAGDEEKQAEAIVRVIEDAQEKLVTRERFDAAIEKHTLGLTVRLGGVVVTAAGIIIAMMRMPH